MDLGLKGRVALVTGGSQGIGFAIAQRLLEEGASVVISARDEERLETARAQLEAYGQVAAVVADVRNPEQVGRMVDAATERFGSLDVLINNAGGGSNFGTFEDLLDEDWLESFELNLLSAVRAARAAVPGMRARGWGRIINIVSESAAQPDVTFPHYGAQKAALLSVTKSMSKTLAGSGILVNAVSPAFVRTPMIEGMLADAAAKSGSSIEDIEREYIRTERPNITVGRTGLPSEIANIVVVLSSDVASFVSGTNVRVDGGSVSTIG